MEFEEAKQELIQGYERLGFKVVEDEPLQTTINFRNQSYVITQEDIQEYTAFSEIRQNYENVPSECSICSTNYREQVVIPLNPYRRPLRMLLRNEKITYGDPTAEELYAEINQPSKYFLNYFRFNKDLHYRRSRFSPHPSTDIVDIRELGRSPETIKIYNVSETTIKRALRKSTQIIEDCIFQLSYLKNISIWLADEWPFKRPSRLRRFRYDEPYPSSNLPLNTRYNSDLVRFYQLGMSTNIPEQKFLSFYQVLEYYFLSVSNEKLYERLSNVLKEPRFSRSESNLNKLVQAVTNHRGETDELEMLKNVLNKFVDKVDLIKFIKAYEKHFDNKRYSKKHKVFGTDIEIKLVENHIIGNVATQIKVIRNALVHSTDKYEGKARHIPFTESAKMIEEDIPLMKYLAERVIISSAT